MTITNITSTEQSLRQRITELEADLLLHQNALWKACGDDEDVVNDTLDSQREEPDCAPNHLCNGRMIHLPNGEQCDKCGN